jgi:hypothetical protein
MIDKVNCLVNFQNSACPLNIDLYRLAGLFKLHGNSQHSLRSDVSMAPLKDLSTSPSRSEANSPSHMWKQRSNNRPTTTFKCPLAYIISTHPSLFRQPYQPHTSPVYKQTPAHSNTPLHTPTQHSKHSTRRQNPPSVFPACPTTPTTPTSPTQIQPSKTSTPYPRAELEIRRTATHHRRLRGEQPQTPPTATTTSTGPSSQTSTTTLLILLLSASVGTAALLYALLPSLLVRNASIRIESTITNSTSSISYLTSFLQYSIEAEVVGGECSGKGDLGVGGICQCRNLLRRILGEQRVHAAALLGAGYAEAELGVFE